MSFKDWNGIEILQTAWNCHSNESSDKVLSLKYKRLLF